MSPETDSFSQHREKPIPSNQPDQSQTGAIVARAWLHRLQIRQKIAWGYGIALTLAIAGTTTGLVIGNHYHRQALERQKNAVKEFRLLDHLHNSALQTRLYRLKLAYALDNLTLLKTEYADFLHHKAEFERSWVDFVATEGYTKDDPQKTLSEMAIVHQFLQTYQQIPNDYFRAVDVLLQQLDLPHLRPEAVADAHARLDAFVHHPTVERLENFSQALLPLVERSHHEYEQAEEDLIAAQTLRLQWIVWSMLSSVAIAVLLVYYTSRAIAQPIHTLATVARRVAQESNFDLQVPTTTSNEVGVLAATFNHLITQVKQLLQAQTSIQAKLTHDAMHDALTGLPNRLLFRERLNHAISLAKRQPDYRFAVLFLDLDQFKSVNDHLGHLKGDQLLIEVANRLLPCLQTVDTISRLGGDEFAILLEAIRNPEEITSIAKRLQSILAIPFYLSGQAFRVTTSIGIVLNNPDTDNMEEILCNADIAMYRAKALGRGQYVFFDAAMQSQVSNRLQLENDLRQVVETLTSGANSSAGNQSELYLVYQPIVDLDTQKLVGFEALVRWQHPDRGLIPPSEFIPVAEETGMIVEIGAWVMQTACHQWVEWQQIAAVASSLSISVNLSGKQLLRADLFTQIQQILTETGLPPSNLKLELTETMLIQQADAAIATLRTLEAMGIQLVIDDFGTGYSSLSYLHRLPISVLKIDRQFIQGINVDCKKLILVKSIISLAENLNLTVVAEGIETTEQLAELVSLQCRYGQGYLFSPPVSKEKVALRLADWCVTYVKS
jgi:diguanylate cyclase (GGDEF)-like protein